MTTVLRFYLILGLIFISSTSFCQWTKLGSPIGGEFNCIEQVGNQIWAGCRSGMYYSDNEGLTWEKSTLFYGICNSIIAFNDTVIICYTEIEGTDYNLKTISSFNNGISFGSPVL